MVTESDFLKVVECEPYLCLDGLSTPLYRAKRYQARQRFAENRQSLIENGYPMFCRAVEFLSLCTLRATPNRTAGSSYRLKHRAENWGENPDYVSNGALIAAVIYLGIRHQRRDDRLNVAVAVSSNCPMVRPQMASA